MSGVDQVGLVLSGWGEARAYGAGMQKISAQFRIRLIAIVVCRTMLLRV
jgi:hypothetical protein